MKKNKYDLKYERGYRSNLEGNEVARMNALGHFINKVIKVGPSKRVLDYGSGNGLFVGLWKNLFPDSDIYFSDISSVALKQLTKKYPEYKRNISLIKKDKTTFNNGFFDVILSVEVMEHVEELNSYLEEIYRLLKRGGVFIWTTPCANRFSIEFIFSYLTNNIESGKDGTVRWKWEEKTYLRRLTSKQIKNILLKKNFKSVIFRFRAHIFSFLLSYLPIKLKIFERIMGLDYLLFRRLPNGASMIGCAIKK